MKKKKKKELLPAIPVVILIIVFSVSIPQIANIEDKMEDSASSNLINVAYLIENNVSAKIQSDMDALTGFADSGVELNPEVLRSFDRGSALSEFTFAGTDGKGCNSAGKQVDLGDLGDAGSGSQVLRNGKPGISECYYGESGRLAIAFGAPVKRDGKDAGMLYAEREVEDYYSNSVFSFYEGAGRGYLVDKQTGEFVLKTLKSDGLSISVGNFFANLEESGNDAGMTSQIENAIAEGETGTARVVYSGSESYLCFTPVEANVNWYLVAIIDESNLMEESVVVRKMIIFMLAVVIGGLCIALGLFFAIAMKGRKEKEQKKRMELLEGITSTVAHAFIVYDPAGKVVEYASENLNRLFGVDSRWVRQDMNHLFDWLGIPSDSSLRSRFLDGRLGGYTVNENQIAGEDQVHWIKSEMSRDNDGKYVMVLTDITKDKEYAQTLSMAMQNAENASRAKSEFLSSMSHDIRTPMNGIVGMTAIAAANAGDQARVKDCLKKISDASAHLLNLINEVLDMSRIESGKSSLNEEAFKLADFMYNLIHMNHSAIERKGQELAIQVTGVQHEDVFADQVKLQQVMTNIVSNSNKYTPEGGKIRISLTERPGSIKGYGCYEFICSDNGIGMSSEFVQKIFDPFERDRGENIRKIQGTGLGMAIVKNIVDMMGGMIKVDSTPGKGTVITVILNLKIQSGEVEEKLPGLPVLVVDDEQMCCTNTVSLLEEIGLRGEWVLTGEAAVAQCVQAHERNEDYFAVILDWKMPGMDGIETARQIRTRVGPEIPIIILTAYNYEQVETQAREAGVTAFLPKPLFKSKLYHKLRYLMGDEKEENVDFRKSMGTFDFHGKRILLVEDNELNMEIAVSILEFTKAEVECAHDGKEALDRYRAVPEGYYDLVLMDIQMPVMNGYEASRAIRRSGRRDSRTLPVIAMTANAFTEDRERAREAGMSGYIAKPIDIQELIITLDRQLGEGK